jgi:asparagine synthase (glutamine-hydrolysing)
MAAAMAHRGPDDSGLFEDRKSSVGLAHARLSILDLSLAGHQPMISDDGRVVLAFNGEIYNFMDLRHELEDLGYCFHGHSDTEVLLGLYIVNRSKGDWCKEILQRLNGIFAFALWDADRSELLLARDAFGVKPLYYSVTNAGFSFASEIKAMPSMLSSCSTQRTWADSGTLDTAAINRYLTYLWCPGEGTPSRQIRKLGPGEAMVVRKGAIVEHRTWYRLPATHDRAKESAGGKPLEYRASSSMNEFEAIRGTEHFLRAAVHRQMFADVNIGAFLSGGIDSSSVTAFARELNPNIQCFTIEAHGGNEDGIVDDLPYSRRVAAHLKVPLEVVRIDAGQMAKDLPAMVAQLDEPLADLAPLNVYYICRRAREQGIKVLLSGTGGDDLFAGYRRHQALKMEHYWTWLPKSVRVGLQHVTQSMDQRYSLGRRLRKVFSGADLDDDSRLVNYFRWAERSDLEALYTKDFRAAMAKDQAETPIKEYLNQLPPDMDRLERMLALEQRFFLADHNLIYTDKMSMAVGVEVRVPFLDLDLVKFAAHIPAHLKQHGREGKWVLKKAMERHLPGDVIYRSKSGFGAPLRRWMRKELRPLLADILSESSLRKRRLFDPKAVNELLEANDKGRIDASYTLLSLSCIELWCRHFMDKPPEPVVTLGQAV